MRDIYTRMHHTIRDNHVAPLRHAARGTAKKEREIRATSVRVTEAKKKTNSDEDRSNRLLFYCISKVN